MEAGRMGHHLCYDFALFHPLLGGCCISQSHTSRLQHTQIRTIQRSVDRVQGNIKWLIILPPQDWRSKEKGAFGRLRRKIMDTHHGKSCNLLLGDIACLRYPWREEAKKITAKITPSFLCLITCWYSPFYHPNHKPVGKRALPCNFYRSSS